MKEILIAGFGGQGVLATGVILANAALRADLQTCWLPSYGGTMRGGTANCSVKISDDEIIQFISEETKKIHKNYKCIITVDREFI